MFGQLWVECVADGVGVAAATLPESAEFVLAVVDDAGAAAAQPRSQRNRSDTRGDDDPAQPGLQRTRLLAIGDRLNQGEQRPLRLRWGDALRTVCEYRPAEVAG